MGPKPIEQTAMPVRLVIEMALIRGRLFGRRGPRWRRGAIDRNSTTRLEAMLPAESPGCAELKMTGARYPSRS